MAKQPDGTKPASNGRPTLRTPELIARVKAALRVGLDWGTAAEVAGVHVRTLANWRDSDEDLDADLRAARANATMRAAVRLQERIDAGDVGAIKFFLTCRSSEFKDGKAAVEINVQSNETTNVIVVGPTPPPDAGLGEWVKRLSEIATEQGVMPIAAPKITVDPVAPTGPKKKAAKK